MQQTSNYGFLKWDSTDTFHKVDINNTFDKIDNEIKSLSEICDEAIASGSNAGLELTQARGTEATLKDRLDGVDSSIDNIAIIGKTATVVDLKPLIEGLSAYETLYLDAKTQYIVTQTIKLKDHIRIIGGYGIDEYVKSTVKFTGTGYMFECGSLTYNNLSVDIRDCIFEGVNNSNGGLNLASQRINIDKCTFKNFDKAINLTTYNGNIVENMIGKCHFYDNNYAIYVDNSVGTNSDGFIKDCIFKGSKVTDIYGKDFDGWIVEGNHFYSGAVTGSNIDIRSFFVRIVNNYFEQAVNHIKLRFGSSNIGSIIVANNIFYNNADNSISIIIDSNIAIDNVTINNNVFKSTISNPTNLICVKGTGTGAKYVSLLNNVNSGYSAVTNSLPNAYVLKNLTTLSTNSSMIELLNQTNNIKFGVCYGNPATVLGNTPAGSLIVDYQNSKYYLSYGTGYRTLPYATTTVNASTATDVAGLKADLNSLIVALKNAAVIW